VFLYSTGGSYLKVWAGSPVASPDLRSPWQNGQASLAPMAGDRFRSATERMFRSAQSRPVSAMKSFGLLTMERVRVDNHGSSRTIWPEAYRMDSH